MFQPSLTDHPHVRERAGKLPGSNSRLSVRVGFWQKVRLAGEVRGNTLFIKAICSVKKDEIKSNLMQVAFCHGAPIAAALHADSSNQHCVYLKNCLFLWFDSTATYNRSTVVSSLI